MAGRSGTQVGNYRLTTLIGRGAFAEVYLGEQVHLGTQAAIKLLQAPLAEASQIEAFRQEARRIAQLSHPHIIRVLEFGFEGELPYLILEHAPGGNLRQRHPVGTPVPLATVLTYVEQAAEALQYAHDQQIIHRDLKPENLLLGRRGEVLLADFGISVVAESTSRQQTREFAGAVAYAAPEQFQGRPRPASDQYALGIVVYEWLTGRLPFTGPLLEIMWKHTQTPPPALRQYVPDLSPAVEEVVLTALAKDTKARFGSVSAFAAALLQADTATLPSIQVGVDFEAPIAGPDAPKLVSLPTLPSPLPAEPAQPPAGPDLPPTEPVAPSAAPAGWQQTPELPPTSTDAFSTLTPAPATSAGRRRLTGTSTPAPVLPVPQKRRVGWVIVLSLLLLVLVGGSSLGVLGTKHQGPLASLFGGITSPPPTATRIPTTPGPPPAVVYIGSGDGSVYALAASDGRQLWRFQTGGSIDSRPAVVAGVVYVGSEDHSVYALAATDGHQLWRFQTGGSVNSRPVVVNGVVYVGSQDHSVYALAASGGRQLWRFRTGGSVSSTPAVVDGVVYVGSGDDFVYALSATNGHQLWSFQTGNSVFSSPAVAAGVVYVGSEDAFVYALAASDGRQLWRFQTGGGVSSTPAVVDGVVYVGSEDDFVYALATSDGNQLWSFQTGNSVFSSPAVAAGVVYVGSEDAFVYALAASDGHQLWRFQTRGGVFSSPAVVAGVVYIGSYALAASDGHQLWYFQAGGAVTSRS